MPGTAARHNHIESLGRPAQIQLPNQLFRSSSGDIPSEPMRRVLRMKIPSVRCGRVGIVLHRRRNLESG